MVDNLKIVKQCNVIYFFCIMYIIVIICRALFPCGDDLVCIIDDREDVWQGCGNLVQVKPYHFFRHTGDIHAPPGLEKRDPSDQSSSPEEEIGSLDTEEQSIDTNKNTNENGINDNVSEETSEDDKKERGKEIDGVVSKSPEDSKESDKTGETLVSSEPSKDRQSNENVDNKSATKTKDQNNDGEIKSSDVPLTDVKKSDEAEIEDNDHDDYLLYLEDILRRVHNEFYKNIDNNDRKPLREIIPQVRVRVLEGLCLTFSGLVPTNHKLEQSRAYKVAVAFGAKVTQVLDYINLFAHTNQVIL